MVRRRWMVPPFLALGMGGLLAKLAVWDDPARRWVLEELVESPSADPYLTLAPPIGQPDTAPGTAPAVDDASALNRTRVASIHRPTTTAEVQALVRLARDRQQAVSLSGARHSMGGQAMAQDAAHLDLSRLAGARYDADTTVTVQAGATWRQVQALLTPHGRAVTVMQDSNIFTVGGSLSVNAHGKDTRYGCIIGTTAALRIVLASGEEVSCSRSERPDLFHAAIGGYGLVGIITEATLRTTEDVSYRVSVERLASADLPAALERAERDGEVHLAEAHLSIEAHNLFSDALLYRWTPTSETPPAASQGGESNEWLRKLLFRLSTAGETGKRLRWVAEERLGPLVDPALVTRNVAMTAPVRFLRNSDPAVTEILQEYFVPRAASLTFLADLAAIIQGQRINLLNATVRLVMKDTEAVVSYALGDMLGIVVYVQALRGRAPEQLAAFTDAVLDALGRAKGTYYLCYGAYGSGQRLAAMYPTLKGLVQAKRVFDPENRFTSEWFRSLVPHVAG